MAEADRTFSDNLVAKSCRTPEAGHLRIVWFRSNVGWAILMIRATMRTTREGREIAADHYGISLWLVPVNHDLPMAAFALNEIVHYAPSCFVRASIEPTVSRKT